MSGLDDTRLGQGRRLAARDRAGHTDGAVLMLGYMNREALAATQASGRVTFWSRSKQRLWTKGETSGHFLEVRAIAADCDGDTLLILAQALGPACHLGTPTCFGETRRRAPPQPSAFSALLDAIIRQRIARAPAGQLHREAAR